MNGPGILMMDQAQVFKIRELTDILILVIIILHLLLWQIMDAQIQFQRQLVLEPFQLQQLLQVGIRYFAQETVLFSQIHTCKVIIINGRLGVQILQMQIAADTLHGKPVHL
ncbi:hypothetical protein ES708_18992 [subsurface metagenome]